MSMPAIVFISSPLNCVTDPMPEEAKVRCDDFCLA